MTGSLAIADGAQLSLCSWPQGLDNVGLGCFVADCRGDIVFCSPTAQRLLGIESVSEANPGSIEAIDRVMGLGIMPKWSAILGGEPFVCSQANCTNLQGHFYSLSVSITLLTGSASDDPSEPVVGVVKQVSGRDDEGAGGSIRILAEVASALSSTQELPHLLKVILTGATASQGLGFNRAFLFLYDENSETLIGRMAVGPATPEEANDIWNSLAEDDQSLAQLLGERSEPKESGADRITQMVRDFSIDLSQPSLIADICHAEIGQCVPLGGELDPVLTTLSESLRTRDIAIVPMISKGKLQGLLVADNFITGQPITGESLRLLQILSNQAAVAMERGRLYDKLYQRATEMERINGLLAQSQDQMIKIEKMSVIGELTSAVAHELRNPLTIVGGFANLMLKCELRDEQREYLGIIAAETRRAETVLDQVLDFSRASRGESRQVEFTQLVRRNLDLIMGRHRLTDSQIELVAPDEPLPVMGNVDQLSHAVFQFINVIVEELVPPSTVSVQTERRGDNVVMTVHVRTDRNRPQNVSQALGRLFADSPASQRLSIIVAGETVRYHGGDYGLAAGGDQAASVYMELPLSKEKHNE